MSPVGLHITIMRKRNHIKSCSGGTRRAQWRCHGHFWHLSTISKVAIITTITINIINIHQHPSTWTPSPTNTRDNTAKLLSILVGFLNLQSLEKHRQIPRLSCLWASGTRRNTSQEKLLGISQSRKVVGEAPGLYVVIQAKKQATTGTTTSRISEKEYFLLLSPSQVRGNPISESL